jgi:hypothetical protein
MRIRSLSLLLTGLVLVLSLACGGGSHSAPATATPAATGLAYTDPSGSGWRLQKDASSTSTRLVLNLVGPVGLKTRGVGFNLQAPATVKFGAFANGLAINDAGVYQLLSAAQADPNEPVALVGGVKSGNLLTAGIFQKDRAHAAQDSGATLCQISFVFDATAGLHAGDKLPLLITKAKVIPEDIGTIADDLFTLDKKMKMADINVAIGSLSAQ